MEWLKGMFLHLGHVHQCMTESWGTKNSFQEPLSEFLSVDSYFCKIKTLLMCSQGIRNVYKIPIAHRAYKQFGDLFPYLKSVKISENFKH